MYDEKRVQNAGEPSTLSSTGANHGWPRDPNPGERSARDEALKLPLDSLGILPARGNRAGGGTAIDVGARVGIIRNLEFSAGGRAHRISTGTYSGARPNYDPKTGRTHVSSSTDTNDSSLGPAAGNKGHAPMTPHVEGAGDTNDTSGGNVDPSRRRDTDTL